jgi:outer membrane protein, multidrug efflux system
MITALALALALAAPPPASADAEPRAWTLEALTAAAQVADPRVLSAAAELARLRGVEAEVRAGGRPSLEWTLSGEGPTPQLENDPARLDAVNPSSRLRNGELGKFGVHTHLGANLTWPVYSFGRMEAYETAAARGVLATAGTAQAARARAARDAAEIYWGYQLARRGLMGLDETDRQLAGAKEQVEKMLANGSSQASKQDVAQLDLVRAELATRRAEASAARELALEAARTVAGVPSDAPFTLTAANIEPPAVQLSPLARYLEVAQAHRPELAAAEENLRAREAVLVARQRSWYPELVVTGSVDLNWTGSTTPQTNPFAWDPYNRLWGSVGLALRGKLDPWRTGAEVAQEEAQVQRARAEAEVARRGVRQEVARAHSALRSALERSARLRDQDAAARRWLSQAELAFDSGSSNPQSVLLAALATARAGAERLAAARDAQLALADLTVAVGEDPRTVK